MDRETPADVRLNGILGTFGVLSQFWARPNLFHFSSEMSVFKPTVQHVDRVNV